MKIGKLRIKFNFDKKAKELGVISGYYNFVGVKGIFVDIAFYYMIMLNFEWVKE